MLRSLCTAAMVIGVFVDLATPAQADEPIWPDGYEAGCETVGWGFLGQDRRVICDGPKRPDGSWMRGRMFLTPAHVVPARSFCSGGAYSSTCTFSEKYYVDEVIHSKDHYPVTDDTVPAGEPGWLPAGTDTGNPIVGNVFPHP